MGLVDLLDGMDLHRWKFNHDMLQSLIIKKKNTLKKSRFERADEFIKSICSGGIDDFLEIDGESVRIKNVNNKQSLYFLVNASLVSQQYDVLIYEVKDIERMYGGLLVNVDSSPLVFIKRFITSKPRCSTLEHLTELPGGLSIPFPEYLFPIGDETFVYPLVAESCDHLTRDLSKKIKGERKHPSYNEDFENFEEKGKIIELSNKYRLDAKYVSEIKEEVLGKFLIEVLGYTKRRADNIIKRVDFSEDQIISLSPQLELFPKIELHFGYKSERSIREKLLRKGEIHDFNRFRVVTMTKEQYYRLAIRTSSVFPLFVYDINPFDTFPNIHGFQSLNTRSNAYGTIVEIQFRDRASHINAEEGKPREYYSPK